MRNGIRHSGFETDFGVDDHCELLEEGLPDLDNVACEP